MKLIRKNLAIALVLALVLVNNITVEAKELDLNNDRNDVISVGQLDDGTNYTVYLSGDATGIASPNFTVGKKFTISVMFDGNVIPPSTWSTTITEGAVEYRGVLYLESYSYDNFLWDKSTVAIYSGTLCGQL